MPARTGRSQELIESFLATSSTSIPTGETPPSPSTTRAGGRGGTSATCSGGSPPGSPSSPRCRRRAGRHDLPVVLQRLAQPAAGAVLPGEDLAGLAADAARRASSASTSSPRARTRSPTGSPRGRRQVRGRAWQPAATTGAPLLDGVARLRRLHDPRRPRGRRPLRRHRPGAGPRLSATRPRPAAVLPGPLPHDRVVTTVVNVPRAARAWGPDGARVLVVTVNRPVGCCRRSVRSSAPGRRLAGSRQS